MTIIEAKAELEAAEEYEEPVVLPSQVLDEIEASDIPEGVLVQVGKPKDGVIHIEWSGTLRQEGGVIVGEADYTWTRKYWYSPVGLEQYLDIVRRAVEVRAAWKGDVKLTHFDDDGAYIQMTFEVRSNETNLKKGFDQIRGICGQLQESAESASDEVGKRIAEVAARVSGWGSQTLDQLVEAVEKASSTDAKGRSLEELMSRLFESVGGFIVTDRVRTATEEIDLSILNDSSEPRFRREGAILLAECKNWSSKCGKNEFVIFKEKIENRSRRSTLGFLVSWNGFKTTLTKELLRGSREETLIVPITGKDIREAVREDDFGGLLTKCWDRAINT
jgi:hypothetical protein